MNTKAMEPMIMVSLILGIVLLGVAAYAFVPKTIDTATDFINNKLIDLGLKTEEIPTKVIDEERIPEGTKIEIDAIPLTKTGNTTTIIKQEYNKGWNLMPTITTTMKFLCIRFWFMVDCTEVYKPILSNKSLIDILSSEKLHGIITINGRIYAHIINTKDNDPDTPDFYWKIIIAQNDTTITYSEEEIPAEEIKNIILNSLYEDETS